MTDPTADTRTRDTRTRVELTPSLVMKLRDGEEAAGRMLDQLYREVLYRFCWGYLRHAAEAEDAVQDICCKVLSAREIPENFRPWLYRVARNHCLNLIRNRGRRRDVAALPPASVIHKDLTGELTKLARQEDRDALASLVESLSDAHQEVLRLRYVEELSRQEIAEVLDLPESVVKSRLFEGLKRLRQKGDLPPFDSE